MPRKLSLVNQISGTFLISIRTLIKMCMWGSFPQNTRAFFSVSIGNCQWAVGPFVLRSVG